MVSLSQKISPFYFPHAWVDPWKPFVQNSFFPSSLWKPQVLPFRHIFHGGAQELFKPFHAQKQRATPLKSSIMFGRTPLYLYTLICVYLYVPVRVHSHSGKEMGIQLYLMAWAQYPCTSNDTCIDMRLSPAVMVLPRAMENGSNLLFLGICYGWPYNHRTFTGHSHITEHS